MKAKKNISYRYTDPQSYISSLENLRQEVNGFKVPDGYFDSLSPRIVDAIKKQENRSFIQAIIPSFRKPYIWAPAMVTALVAVLLLFVIPLKKESSVQVVNQWEEINMAYDASYAEEALLAESYTIENELEKADINNIESVSYTGANEATDEEITEYLKNQDIDSDLLIAN
jgi:hypothetical protein